jgi:hypothetical protein
MNKTNKDASAQDAMTAWLRERTLTLEQEVRALQQTLAGRPALEDLELFVSIGPKGTRFHKVRQCGGHEYRSVTLCHVCR